MNNTEISKFHCPEEEKGTAGKMVSSSYFEYIRSCFDFTYRYVYLPILIVFSKIFLKSFFILTKDDNIHKSKTQQIRRTNKVINNTSFVSPGLRPLGSNKTGFNLIIFNIQGKLSMIQAINNYSKYLSKPICLNLKLLDRHFI